MKRKILLCACAIIALSTLSSCAREGAMVAKSVTSMAKDTEWFLLDQE